MKTILRKILFVQIFCSLYTINAQTWSQIGPLTWPNNSNNLGWSNGLGNGQITSIWIDPNNSNHALIGGFSGGIFETTNLLSNNVTWTPKTSNIPLHTIWKINSANINNVNILFASSGFRLRNPVNFSNMQIDSNLYGMGVVKSIDGGNNWIIPSMPNQEKGFYCAAFSNPITSGTSAGLMYAVSDKSLLKTTDFGNNWTEVSAISSTGLWSLEIKSIVSNPNNPNEIWISGYRGDGINNLNLMHSTNGGLTWDSKQQIDTFVNSLINGFGTIKDGYITTDNLNNLYICIYNGSKIGILRSTNWTHFSTVTNSSAPGFSDIRLKVNNGNYYLAQMPGFYKLINGAFSSLKPYNVHDDIRDIKFLNNAGINYIFIGTDGGIYRSSDEGINWTNITGNYVCPLINSMGYFSNPTDRAFDIGTQDTGFYRNEMDGNSLFATRGHEGFAYTNPLTKRAYYNSGISPENAYSDNNGVTISAAPGSVLYVNDDPLDCNLTYFPNGNGFLKHNWSSNQSTICAYPFTNTKTTYIKGQSSHISLNSNKNIISTDQLFDCTNGCIHLNNDIMLSQDGGNTWENVGKNIKTADASGLPDLVNTPNSVVSSLTMDDFNPNRIWATFGTAFYKDRKVYESNDSGKTWKNISLNLADVQSLGLPINTPSNFPVNVVEFDENRDVLYLGTDYGLFYLDKTATPNQWKVFGFGLPREIVTNIFIDDYYNEIVVGLFGRGVWHAPLTDCKDELVMSNANWSGLTKTICGDLRVKHDLTLNVTNSSITARNVILEPGAKIILSGGFLSSSDTSRKSYVICARDSKFSVTNNATINNFIGNAFEAGTIETGNITLNNSSINVYKSAYYDFIANTKLLMTNANLNFYTDYYYKTHNTTVNPINATTFLSSMESINTNGFANNGKVNIYDNVIKIQNENLGLKTTPTANTSSYLFQANNYIVTGNNVDSSIAQGDFNTAGANTNVDMIAKNYIELNPGTSIANSQAFIRIDTTLPDIIIKPYNKVRQVLPNMGNQLNFDGDAEEHEEQKNITINAKKDDRIKIYPIPVSAELNYQISDKDLIGKKALIINSSGNVVKTVTLNSKNGIINFTDMAPGVYFFVVDSKEGKISKKIIKQGLTEEKPIIENSSNEKSK